jgi:hypothetical protein
VAVFFLAMNFVLCRASLDCAEQILKASRAARSRANALRYEEVAADQEGEAIQE